MHLWHRYPFVFFIIIESCAFILDILCKNVIDKIFCLEAFLQRGITGILPPSNALFRSFVKQTSQLLWTVREVIAFPIHVYYLSLPMQGVCTAWKFVFWLVEAQLLSREYCGPRISQFWHHGNDTPQPLVVFLWEYCFLILLCYV